MKFCHDLLVRMHLSGLSGVSSTSIVISTRELMSVDCCRHANHG